MKKPDLRKLFLLFSLLTIVLLGSIDVYGQGPPINSVQARANAIRDVKNTIENISQEKPKVFTTSDKYVRFMMAPPGTSFAVDQAYRNTHQQAANWFLNNWSVLFGNYTPRNNFRFVRDIADKSNNHYLRYQQYYNGLEVYGAQLNCMVDAYGGVVAILSDIMRDTSILDSGNLSLNSKLSQIQAQKSAIEFLSNEYPELVFKTSEPKLMIYDPKVAGFEGQAKLVWKTEVQNIGELDVKERLFIDATNGKIVLHYSLIFKALDREIWDYDGETSNPTLEREEGDPNTLIPDVDDVYLYLKNTYDFYYFNHGWENYDNKSNSKSIAKVRYNEYDSRWLVNYMQIGIGEAIDDVVGHEFTHGVTANTSQLQGGTNESGAINESFSDMWGEWIDQTNGISKTGSDQSSDKWLIAEDDPYYGPWRDMKDPNNPNADQPGPSYLYEEGYWDENGEPHTNAGVGNKLCYLLTDGDSFMGYNISGLGISKASDLFWECQAHWLMYFSDYKDLGFCLQIAAVITGLSDSERENVANACRAVEIYDDLYSAGISFGIKDSSDLYTVVFDEVGNLFLKGILYENRGLMVDEYTNIDEFLICYGEYVVFAIENDSGNLFIAEEMIHTENMSGANNFIIKNGSGNTVAYVDTDGYLYLTGYVFEERPLE